MRYLSICSGIEAASVAWMPLGWKPIAFAEIDKFPSEVLAHHYPDVPNVGDFTKIGKEWRGKYDLLIGGTPCQDFSVAGKRAGFEGARGTLTYAFAELVHRTVPTWFVWENVPGVLQGETKDGFIRFVKMLSDFGYCVSWRIIDAQYCRVDGFERAIPQRRRRVFIVGSLGNQCSAEVLFKPSSMCGHFEEVRGKRKKDSGDTKAGANYDVAKTITTREGLRYDQELETLIAIPINSQLTKQHNDGDKSPIGIGKDLDPLPAITTKHHHIVGTNRVVRRLTPVECERLMGFPDNYTKIPGASDTKRYKALGNSMAVNVIRWIGKQIEEKKTCQKQH